MTLASKWVTMGDVAREAKVSKITVSRVLRSPEKVKPETCERVQAAIQALGYVPDEAAGALASGESRMVAAVVPTLEGSTFASTIDGLGQYLREHGHQLLLGNAEYSSASEAALLSMLFGHRPDGIVLTRAEHSLDAVAQVRGTGIPVVEVWELPENPIDMAVGYSNLEAGQAMTRFLFDIGRRRIAYIGGGPTANLRSRLRFDGYAKAYRALGLGEPPIVPYDRTIPSASERGALAMRWILKNRPETDAVFCSSDAVALGALEEGRRRGKCVPKEIAIAGLGDFEFAGQYGLGLTTVKIPGRKIGEAAARMLLERKRDGEGGPKVIDVGFEIIRRATA
jgi:LacI family transcriptional regulator, gluconate utilization system Gnt-I transcriptional repressor